MLSSTTQIKRMAIQYRIAKPKDLKRIHGITARMTNSSQAASVNRMRSKVVKYIVVFSLKELVNWLVNISSRGVGRYGIAEICERYIALNFVTPDVVAVFFASCKEFELFAAAELS